MCGRYYVDDETVSQIEEIIRNIDKKLNAKSGDVYPTNSTLVMNSYDHKLSADDMVWGFPDYNSKKVIINARSETVTERKMFRDSLWNRRCVIPASGFYEWKKDKTKFTFSSPDTRMIFIAGIWKPVDDRNQFVLLTTAANASVADVHDRMPLILPREEIEDWILDDACVEDFLHRTPAALQKVCDYEQGTLSFV